MNIANIQRLAGVASDIKQGKSIEDLLYDKAVEKAKDVAKSVVIKVIMSAAGLWIMTFLVVALVVILVITSFLSSFQTKPGHLAGKPTSVAVTEIGELFPIFEQAQERYGVSWAVLAAIAKIESGFGKGDFYLKCDGISYAGAVGFMQFMPTTWSGGNNPLADNSPENPSWDEDPATIAKYGGYGTDGDDDGRADPYNPWDAIFSAAKLLKANNVETNPEGALLNYNHSRQYVNQVMAQALEYSIYQVPVMNGVWPVSAEYTEVTATFGQIYNREGTKVLWPSGHTGIDISCPEGTPVFAVISGRVSFAGKGAGGYGNYIKIESGEGTAVAYAHLSKIDVNTLQQVKQGEIIGNSGNTGRSYGAHLHFETWVDNRLSDPLMWLQPPGQNY